MNRILITLSAQLLILERSRPIVALQFADGEIVYCEECNSDDIDSDY